MKRVLLFALVLPGCALFRPNAVVENRFALEVKNEDAAAPVAIEVTSAPVPDGDDKVKITQLAERAQAALILATSGKPPTEISGAKGEGAADVVFDGKFARRLVAAVRPTGFLSPGDRVDAIRLSLSVPPDQANDLRITGWTQATNGQSVIDVGKLTDVSSSKLTASTGLDIGKPFADAKAEAGFSRALTREQAIKDTTDFDAPSMRKAVLGSTRRRAGGSVSPTTCQSTRP